jgi:hypothetical protein
MRRTLLLGFLAACSVDQTIATTGDLAPPLIADMTGPRDLIPRAGDLATSYPAGPYGNKVGDVIPPLVWEGYSDPLADAIATSKPYGPYSMDDLRRSGRPYAAIHVAEFA